MKHPKLLKVNPLEDCKLELTYEGKKHKRIFDVKPYIKGDWYGELANAEYFSKVFIGPCSIEWPHDQGICPDELHEYSKPIR